MLTYDGIVFKLQRTGGISVLFTEIISRLRPSAYELVSYGQLPGALETSTHRTLSPRPFERYRRACVGARCDLFHSTFYRLPASRTAKVVTTAFDFVDERFASPLRRVRHSVQKNRALAGSDRIICISESTRRDLVEFAGAALAERAVVVPCGVSEQFRPLPGVTRLPQVLFVGSRVSYKNFPAVVNALSELPEVDLVCVGAGPFKTAELELLDRRIPGRYRWAGYLSTEALNLEYNRSICLAYCSFYEGFGIPILEAMRAGCPVIAVNASSVPEVAGDAGILLERGEADELRAAIRKVMVSATRDELVRRGMAQSSKFSWQTTFDRTIAIYEEVLGKPIGHA
jgi:mannosyltransferase